MRFPLKAIFVATLVAALWSYTYLNQQKNSRLEEQVVQLENKIALETSGVGNLKERIELYTAHLESVKNDSQLADQLRTKFEAVQKKYHQMPIEDESKFWFVNVPALTPTDNELPGYNSVTGLPDAELHEWSVFVPTETDLELVIDLTPNEPNDPVKLEGLGPLKMKLPIGRSKIVASLNSPTAENEHPLLSIQVNDLDPLQHQFEYTKKSIIGYTTGPANTDHESFSFDSGPLVLKNYHYDREFEQNFRLIIRKPAEPQNDE